MGRTGQRPLEMPSSEGAISLSPTPESTLTVYRWVQEHSPKSDRSLIGKHIFKYDTKTGEYIYTGKNEPLTVAEKENRLRDLLADYAANFLAQLIARISVCVEEVAGGEEKVNTFFGIDWSMAIERIQAIRLALVNDRGKCTAIKNPNFLGDMVKFAHIWWRLGDGIPDDGLMDLGDEVEELLRLWLASFGGGDDLGRKWNRVFEAHIGLPLQRIWDLPHHVFKGGHRTHEQIARQYLFQDGNFRDLFVYYEVQESDSVKEARLRHNIKQLQSFASRSLVCFTDENNWNASWLNPRLNKLIEWCRNIVAATNEELTGYLSEQHRGMMSWYVMMALKADPGQEEFEIAIPYDADEHATRGFPARFGPDGPVFSLLPNQDLNSTARRKKELQERRELERLLGTTRVKKNCTLQENQRPRESQTTGSTQAQTTSIVNSNRAREGQGLARNQVLYR